MSKYTDAIEVKDEYMADKGTKLMFKEWCREKDKPVDPLFEKYNKIMEWEDDNRDKGLEIDHFNKFKEILGPELNGTLGLDEAIKEFGNYDTTYTPEYVVRQLKEIKERLEKEL